MQKDRKKQQDLQRLKTLKTRIKKGKPAFLRVYDMVDPKGFEPSASAMRTRRSRKVVSFLPTDCGVWSAKTDDKAFVGVKIFQWLFTLTCGMLSCCKEVEYMNNALKKFYYRFYTPLPMAESEQEIETCHQQLIERLEKPERKLVLRIMDAQNLIS